MRRRERERVRVRAFEPITTTSIIIIIHISYNIIPAFLWQGRERGLKQSSVVILTCQPFTLLTSSFSG